MINKVGKVSEPHDLRFNTYVAPPIYQDVPSPPPSSEFQVDLDRDLKLL